MPLEEVPVFSPVGLSDFGPWRRMLRLLIAIACGILSLGVTPTELLEPGTKATSQCFTANTISFVTLYCGIGKVVHVQRAFYGISKDPSNGCFHTEGDCTLDMGSQYDWSRCEARHSCVQLVQQVGEMPSCDAPTPTYFQVHYTCVKGTATSYKPISANKVKEVSVVNENETPTKTKPSPAITITKMEQGIKAANICLNKTLFNSDLYVQTPGYPHFYPYNMDCRCEIMSKDEGSITVTFEDVQLSMEDGLCDDWLMLESPMYKGAGVVVCHDIDAGRKSLQSRSSHIILHFHSMKSMGVKNLRGFSIRVTSSKDMTIDCYKTMPSEALKAIPPGSASADPDRPYALPPTNFGVSRQKQDRSAVSRTSISPVIYLLTIILTLLKP